MEVAAEPALSALAFLLNFQTFMFNPLALLYLTFLATP